MKLFNKKYLFPVNVFVLMGILLIAVTAASAASDESDQAPGRVMAQQATKTSKVWITADHTKLDALKKTFKTGAEITQACLSCHSEAESQFHKTIHWTWIAAGTEDQHGKASYSLNNFCISTNKTEDTSCLAGLPATEKAPA